MERKCKRCKSVEIIDDYHNVCYECFVELDLEQHEKELKHEEGMICASDLCPICWGEEE